MKYIMICAFAIIAGITFPACRNNTNCSSGNTDSTQAMQALPADSTVTVDKTVPADNSETVHSGTQVNSGRYAGGRNDTFVTHKTQAMKAEKKREGNFTNGSPN